MFEGFPLVLLGVVCVVSAIVYVLFMIFLPEWVGITGKTALRNEREHREGSLEIDRVHQEGQTQADAHAQAGADAGANAQEPASQTQTPKRPL